jgi:hypothetical protein
VSLVKESRALHRVGVTCFRVYPRRRRSGLFVNVRVFGSRREMHECLEIERKHDGGRRIGRRTQGVMKSYKRRLGRRTTCELGSVNLHRGRLGVAVVCHEFAHVAFAWSDRKRLFGPLTQGDPRTMPLEERFCHALDEMVRQFVERAYKLGLYEGTARVARTNERGA